jgi:hypothetical protein
VFSVRSNFDEGKAGGEYGAGTLPDAVTAEAAKLNRALLMPFSVFGYRFSVKKDQDYQQIETLVGCIGNRTWYKRGRGLLLLKTYRCSVS